MKARGTDSRSDTEVLQSDAVRGGLLTRTEIREERARPVRAKEGNETEEKKEGIRLATDGHP